MQESAHDDIRVQLYIGPIVEGKVSNTVEEFLLFLEQNMFIERCETVPVLLEGFIQHHVLNPTVFNNFFFATGQAMLIDLQNVLSIVGLDKESN